jgi:MFS family permease
VARAVQGLGGAVVSAISLSLIMNLFTEPAERAKAMGVYGFVCAGGGSIGVLLGGVLTGLAELALDLPRQPAHRRIAVFALCLATVARWHAGQAGGREARRGGAVTVTAWR